MVSTSSPQFDRRGWHDGARGARGLAVLRVAGRAAQPFVDAGGGAVVAREDLAAGARCVALVAEGLSPVGARLHDALAVVHDRQRQPVEADVLEGASVVEGEGRRGDGLVAAFDGRAILAGGERRAVAMDLVAGEAGHGGQTGVGRPHELPRALSVERASRGRGSRPRSAWRGSAGSRPSAAGWRCASGRRRSRRRERRAARSAQSAASWAWQAAQRATRGATSWCRMWICSGLSPRACSHTRSRFFACIRRSAVNELPWQSLQPILTVARMRPGLDHGPDLVAAGAAHAVVAAVVPARPGEPADADGGERREADERAPQPSCRRLIRGGPRPSTPSPEAPRPGRRWRRW